jgi:tRNA-specific 2-thiouridylase
MSGGVDSTACALMLREKYQVQGFFMQLAQPDLAQQRNRVKQIAKKLDIELQIVDLHDAFTEKVLDYFSQSYFSGLTPNPCVICNREIKFGLFLQTILKAGMEKMATGHYATIKRDSDRSYLYMGDDPRKDQSYFLSRLTKEQLTKIVFPLGTMNKESIYQFVEAHGFHDFRGRESQDVCFLQNNRVGNFLEKRATGSRVPGQIVSTSGKVLGSHNGLFRYTIGQRKGLGISSSTPLYVLAINAASNTVVVGGNDELFRKSIAVKKLHWLSGEPPDLNREYTVRIRYSHRGSLAKLAADNNNSGILTFQEAQRAVTPGQFAVFYDQKELLGSGIIALVQ